MPKLIWKTQDQDLVVAKGCVIDRGGDNGECGVVTVRKGKRWNLNFPDRRSTIWRMLFPMYATVTAESDSTLHADSGGQFVAEYSYLRRDDIRAIYTAAKALQDSTFSSSSNLNSVLYNDRQILPIASGPHTGGRMILPENAVRMVFKNVSNFPGCIEIYEYECIRDTTCSAYTYWVQDMSGNNNIPSSIIAALPANTSLNYNTAYDASVTPNYTTYGNNPQRPQANQSHYLHSFYRCVSKVKATVPPLRSLVFKTEVLESYADLFELGLSNDTNSVLPTNMPQFLSGRTRSMIIIARGVQYINSNLDTNETDPIVLSTSSCNFAFRIEQKKSCFQLQNIAQRNLMQWDGVLPASGLITANNMYAQLPIQVQATVNPMVDEVETGFDNNWVTI